MGGLILGGSFAVSVLLFLLAAYLFKVFRRRGRKRSPLQRKKLANLPGQQLAKRIGDHSDEMLLSFVVAYFSLPLMLGAWAMARVRWESVRFGIYEGMFAATAAALFLSGFARFFKYAKARVRAEDGLIAEQMTGQHLNRLIGPNCIVAHDLPCDGFNIDHIVIGPRAVYAVETKSFRKHHVSEDDSHYKVTDDGTALQFPGWRETDAIAQAKRQAQWLARYLRDSLARDVPVLPAVALPGWYIVDTPAARNAEVRVFTPMGRGAQILVSGNEVLDGAMRALAAQAIAQRYPDIEG